jgi:hypothetical protein
MKIRKLISVVVVLILSATSYGHASEASIWIAGVEMRLGEPKQKILSQFGEKYNVSKWSVGDMYGVRGRNADSDTYYGSMTFETDKLIAATRRHGDYWDTGALSLAQALLRAVESVAGSEPTVAVIVRRSFSKSGFSTEDLDIVVGEKTLSFGIGQQPESSPVVGIIEYLRPVK